MYSISKAVQLQVQGQWYQWVNYMQGDFSWKSLLALPFKLFSFCLTSTFDKLIFSLSRIHFPQNKDKKVEICRLSTIPMKFIKFLTSFLKLPAWISSNFVSLFSFMTHNFIVKFQSVIGTEQVQEVFTPSTAPVKSTNCLYHVWKYQPNFWEIWH